MSLATITPLLTSRKVLDITYQTPQETLLGTPETLPTSEPATPQIGYTIESGHLPTLSFEPYARKWVARLWGAGKCVTAATVSYRMKKNGSSVKTATLSVSANYYYTFNCAFFDVAVGDVLELALWSNQTDSNWDYKALWLCVSRIILLNKPRLMINTYFNCPLYPTLTLGNPAINTTSSSVTKLYHLDQVIYTSPIGLGFTKSFTSQEAGDSYTLICVGFGDLYLPNSAVGYTDSTKRPAYCKSPCPSQILGRGVRID